MNYGRELSRFQNYLTDRVSPGTVKVYMNALELWFRSLNGSSPTKESAQAYVDSLVSKGKSASTASLRAHAIMRWFKWKGQIIALDCPTIRLGEPEYLTVDQIELLLANSRTELERVLVVVLFDTAVRIGELLGIEQDDIGWDTGFISVMRKGGRREEVNISERGLEALRAWMNARESRSKRVFMDIPYMTARDTLKALGKRVGIEVRPHIFRHSRAIYMLMNGATLHDVQGHLGHRSIVTTANIYGRFKAVDLKQRIPSW